MLPKGIATSGFPRVRETCRSIGITFDPWQVDLNRCMLGKTADGMLAADTVALSIARQVGKTFDVGAVEFAECITVPETTVVWTAHRFKVARETFNELRMLAKSPKLVPHLDYDEITTAAGNECIPFRNGSRIVFAARERGAIRGFTKVRRLVLDEAQILTEAALSDLLPTMNQAVDPQIILMGTPPKPTDPSEVWVRLRTDALEGDSEGLLYVEFSAEPGSDLDDRKAWKQANPSFPSRTPARAIMRLRKLLSDDDFAREALGIWDTTVNAGVIPLAGYNAGRGDATEEDPVAFGLDVTWDREWCSIGWGVGDYADIQEHGRGTAWVVEKCKALQARFPVPVFVMAKGPAAVLLDDLRDGGVIVEEVPGEEYARACGAIFDAIAEGRFKHSGHPALDAAVAGAQVSGGQAWVWDKKRGAVISPLVAVTLARHGAKNGPSVYENRELLVF